MQVTWQGCAFNAAYLVNHYRKMATRQPASASFWRGLARQVIAKARTPEQQWEMAA